MSTYADSSPYYHTTTSVMWSWTNIRLFRVLLSYHTKTHPWTAVDLNPFRSNLDVQQPIFFGPHDFLLSMEHIPSVYYFHRPKQAWSLFWIVWLETLRSTAKRNCLKICVALTLLICCGSTLRTFSWSMPNMLCLIGSSPHSFSDTSTAFDTLHCVCPGLGWVGLTSD